MRTLIALAFATVATGAFAAIDMNHVDENGSAANLIGTPGFGVQQIFGDFADFSGTVIDDFKASGSTVARVATVFEISNPALNFANIRGWQLSFWKSKADAEASGNGLNGNTVAQMMLGGPDSGYVEKFGTGAVGRAFYAEWNGGGSGIGLGGLTVGNVYYIGMAPVLDFTNNGQVFILSHTNPATLGNGTANDSHGINPGNGFGLGTGIPVGSNAAYGVDTVPEPATMIALGAGLAALARKRRK